MTACRSSAERGLTGSSRSGRERDQRRTVVQIVDRPLVVPSLDVPVPQMENQLVEVCRHLDLPIPKQAIEVPKISLHPVFFASARFLRCSRRRNSWWKCLQLFLSIRCTGLWSRMWTFQFLMVVVVGEVSKSLDRVQQRFVEQTTLTFWFRVVEVFKAPSRDRSPLLYLRTRLVLWMRLYMGFSHFSQKFRKVRQHLITRGRGCPRSRAHPRRLPLRSPASLRTATSIMKMMRRCTRHSNARVLRSASSSELSDHQMAWIAARAASPQDFSDDGNIFREDEEKIWIRLDTGQWKLLCTDIVVDQPWP